MGFNGRMSGAGGVITIYTGDDTITDPVRNVQIGTTLNFLYGAAGINGSVQMTTGGYFKNTTNAPGGTNYFEYNHNDGTFLTQSDTHTRTGFKAQRSGVFGEMMTGGGKTYFNTNGYFEWYTNNTGIYAGQLSSSGNWGFGIAAPIGAKVRIQSDNGQGFGTIIGSYNLSPAESILQVRDASETTRLDVRANGVIYINNRLIAGYSLGSVVSTAAVVVKGADSAYSSYGFEFTDGSNVSRLNLRNNGVLYHSSISNHIDSDMSAAHNVTYRYFGAATNHIHVINAAFTGGTVPGNQTTAPIRGYFYGIITSTGVGVQGRAYLDNAAMGADGIQGYVSGNNWNKAVGVHGLAIMQGAGGSDVHAGLFESNISVDPSNTIYGVKGTAVRSTVGNGTFIGGHFEAENGNVNVALRTPANKGTIVFGALVPVNNSLVEVNGDLEIIGIVKGVVLQDRTLGTRHRIYLDNGVLSLEAA
jgi:hypothetical protein